MARRRIAFVLAFVLSGGPFAGNVCDAFCARYAEQSIDSPQPVTHHHHSEGSARELSHHDNSPAAHASVAPSVRLIALPRDCSSVDAVFSESRVLTRAFATTVAVPVVHWTSSDERVLPIAEMESRHGPPAPVRSALPLRI